MKLLIQGEVILAADDKMLVTDDRVFTYTPEGKVDCEFPLHVIEGWQIVDVDLPEGFTCAGYAWQRGGLVAKAVPAAKSPAPYEVQMYQARAALIKSGLMAKVQTVLAGLSGETGELVRAYFEFSPTVRRDHRYILMLQPVLELSDDALDDLMRLAATF